MSPENECSRFKQNAWKKELCSNCFRPREEHPEKPKRVRVDYKPLPDISPAQSILKVVNGSCDKTRNVSFSNVESEVIGYGGEEYSTDEEYSSDDDQDGLTGWTELSGDDEEELKRLTDANTNLNGKPTSACTGGKVVVDAKQLRPATKSAPIATATANNNNNNTTAKSSSPPLVVVQPFGSEHATKSLVFNFLKNKEIAAAAKDAAAAAATAAQRSEKKETTTAVQLRKPCETTKKPSLTRSSLTANSNEQFLNMKRCSLPPAEERSDKPAVPANVEIPKVKLHPPETTVMAAAVGDKCAEDNDDEASAQAKESADPTAPYKTRSNVPRMGTMHFKLKLAVASSQKPDAPKPAAAAADSTPDSSLTSREMAGEPDGKADSDEPGDPTITTSSANVPVNRSSFLHNFKAGSPPPRDTTTPPRTPPKKTSITSANSSPPECPRSIKRQAPKPPPPTPPQSATKCTEPAVHGRHQQQQQQQLSHHRRRVSSSSESGPDEVTVANRKLLAEYCEQIEKEQLHRGTVKESSPVEVGDVPRESATLPLPNKRPVYEKKKFGKAGRVGLKIKKFLRIPGRDLISGPTTPSPPPRPKLEIIHPLDINKSAVEIIHNAAEGVMQLCGMDSSRGPINHYAARPTKPPPPPRSLPPAVAKHPPPPPLPKSSKSPVGATADRADGASSRTCGSSSSSSGASDETTAYEPVNFSAPECDHLHSSPETARLTSVQYCGSETESDIYPAIQFGDDFGAEDSIRNTRPGHKSLEESYDAVVIANHEALTKLLDQATCGGPRVPKDLLPLMSKTLQWSSFRVDPTSRLRKSGCAFYNAQWNDVPVVLSISGGPVELNNVLNNHFTLTKVTQFATRVEKELSPSGGENQEAYVTLWNAHRVEAVESYCNEYNAKYADVTKEAGLVLVETVNLLMGLQAADVHRYSLEPFVVTRNGVGAEPSVAVVQLADAAGFEDDKEDDALCDVMLKMLRLLAPTWEMTVCLSQVLRQARPNSLSKCKALLEFWLWGPTGATVTPDRPLSLKRWLDLERANDLHGHVCSRSADVSVEHICYMSFLVANDDRLFADAWTVLADRNVRPPRDPTVSKC